MGILLGIIATVVGLIGAVIFRSISLNLDSRNMPDDIAKNIYIEEVRQLRERGKNYNERLVFLRRKGLRRRVADHILREDILR